MKKFKKESYDIIANHYDTYLDNLKDKVYMRDISRKIN